MNLPEGVNYEDVTLNAKVTGVEKANVQATAYFTPPTEETKHIHEKMLQMCLDDLNAKMEKKHGNSSTSTVRTIEGTQKVKKYRKRTESEKERRRQQKLQDQQNSKI